MLASHNGHVEVVDKLIEHGATVDLQTQVITVLIHMFVCSYTLCMVFTKQDNDTALIIACQEENLTTASILLKAGAYPNICNKVTCKLTYCI